MTTVKQETEVPEGYYVLRVLDKSGDTRTPWKLDDPASVAETRKKFDEIVKGQKFLAYTVPADGSTGEAIREFDPEIKGDIVLTPQMQGG